MKKLISFFVLLVLIPLSVWAADKPKVEKDDVLTQTVTVAELTELLGGVNAKIADLAEKIVRNESVREEYYANLGAKTVLRQLAKKAVETKSK